MRRLILFVPVILFCVSLKGSEVQKEIEKLTFRLVEKQLEVKVDKKAIARYLDMMQPDGSFIGIDYVTVTNNFRAGPHLKYLKAMAVAYRKKGSGYTGSKELYRKILSGLDYWLKMRPVSKNWWFNDIGAPQDYMVPLILLKDEMSKDKLLYYSSYLEDKTGNKAHRGKNRTWVSNITIHKGCIEDNIELIRIGFHSIASTIQIVSRQGDEGIKIDGSFHQHRPQLYSGGYGMSYVNDLTDFFLLARGTSFEELFDADKLKIVRELMLNGERLFGYRSTFEHGANGRGITRKNGIFNISASTLDKMVLIDPSYAKEYRLWQKHLKGSPFPVPGNKFFWKSDIMVQHGKNYYLSAKVVSKRTNGTEMINDENLKGYNLPLGAMQILTSSEEYKNIYPLWNWCMLPGTTAIQQADSAILRGYLFGTNEFAGGVSNGKNGVIAYEHDYRGGKAKKAYFFMNDVVLCLGADINSKAPEEVFTTVNQCFFTGSMTVNDGSKEWKYKSGQEMNNPKWVYHDRIGYLFLDETKRNVCSRIQTGAWNEIDLSGSSERLSGDIFNLWVDHGTKASDGHYAYMLVPDCTLKNFRSFVKKHTYEIISNTSFLQAVRLKKEQIYAAVFYTPGTVVLDDGITLCSDKKAVVYIEKQGEKFKVWAADPLYSQKEVTLTLNGKDILLTFPAGDYVGNTVSSY
ncbi:polysaccharide lyase family 8 super-sandwich domain-containing protein [Bacteroides faecalis]|uniref:Chloramphenicol resistance protein n=1 Tax=Bacteroides faecalis TaxID=2447885 RepID=A0A401LQZ0_9BACE|nr:polysaccharide lyase family 8 super-sandwich domain-containing protein [Bacteroides faecalis]GCB33965.1 chloramphenicol resistance protein [Bacteroides faecalis]